MYDDIDPPLQYHTETIHSGFTALKILCALPVHLSPTPQPLATTELFTVSIVLTFLECHLVGFLYYVAFFHYVVKETLVSFA